MNRTSLLLSFVLLSTLSIGCAAERSAPLPGSSVSADGAVSLATPRLTTIATAPAPAAATVPPPPAIESRLFPAELVMENRALRALTPAQEEAISKELDRSQSELVKLQWALQAEKDKLLAVLDEAKVDETRSQKAAAALMQRENAIKGAHLALLVRVRNVLTPEQQAKLRASREEGRCPPKTPALPSSSDAAGPP